MRCRNAGMVREHKTLVFQYQIEILSLQQHLRPVHSLRDAVRQIAHIIDTSRNKHKKQHTPHTVGKESCPAEPERFCAITQSDKPEDQPDHCQSCAGIKAGPFACRPDPEKHS